DSCAAWTQALINQAGHSTLNTPQIILILVNGAQLFKNYSMLILTPSLTKYAHQIGFSISQVPA
ncbi:MAG: hypothetical protein WCS87_18625, partial [Methylococcaceae bacterium]